MKKLAVYLILAISCFAISFRELPREITHPYIEINSAVLKDELGNELGYSTGIDTIKIHNNEEKLLLKVLAVLPDSAMGSSWKWTRSERRSLVDFAFKNNCILNKDKIYNVKKILNSTHFFTQVVDGYWELKIFKISNNDYVALTHNVTGDGDEFFFYQYKDSNLSDIFLWDVIPTTYLSAFFKSTKPVQCKIVPDTDFEIGLDYEFNYDTLIVSNDYAKYDSICFDGNTLNLIFNREKRKFDIDKVYWDDLGD